MATELKPGQKRFTAGAVFADIAIVAWFIFALFPILWMLLLALKNDAQQTSTYFAFSPTLENFGTVLSQRGTDLTSVDFKTAILMSIVNCVGAVLVSLVIGIPAAYAAGRWKFKGSEDLMFNMLSFRFAPELMVIVPLFVIYDQFGLFDTVFGMIWVLQLVTMPLIVWILRSYFEDMPEDLEQAALLDGYTRRQAFTMVALPPRNASRRRRRACSSSPTRCRSISAPACSGGSSERSSTTGSFSKKSGLSPYCACSSLCSASRSPDFRRSMSSGRLALLRSNVLGLRPARATDMGTGATRGERPADGRQRDNGRRKRGGDLNSRPRHDDCLRCAPV